MGEKKDTETLANTAELQHSRVERCGERLLQETAASPGDGVLPERRRVYVGSG
jgi:hypothetical protein